MSNLNEFMEHHLLDRLTDVHSDERGPVSTEELRSYPATLKMLEAPERYLEMDDIGLWSAYLIVEDDCLWAVVEDVEHGRYGDTLAHCVLTRLLWGLDLDLETLAWDSVTHDMLHNPKPCFDMDLEEMLEYRDDLLEKDYEDMLQDMADAHCETGRFAPEEPYGGAFASWDDYYSHVGAK